MTSLRKPQVRESPPCRSLRPIGCSLHGFERRTIRRYALTRCHFPVRTDQKEEKAPAYNQTVAPTIKLHI